MKNVVLELASTTGIISNVKELIDVLPFERIVLRIYIYAYLASKVGTVVFTRTYEMTR